MTIKQISKLVSLTLAGIIIMFAIAVSWSLNHLNQSFGSVNFFGEQKDKIFTQVSQPILNYLLTGEATILGKIDQDLNHIKSDVQGRQNLSASLQAPFLGLIAELQEKTLIELANAGKLADPQVLLINNEKQLSQYLQKLLSYTKEAQGLSPNVTEMPLAEMPLATKEAAVTTPKEKPKSKGKAKTNATPITTANAGSAKLSANVQTYVKLISESQAALINLARARQNFFSSRKQLSPDSVTQPLQELIALGSEFKKLPLLGVMKQQESNENSFSLTDSTETQAPEDKAIEPINEIPSLLQHYNKDLETALKVAQDKVQGQAKVSEQISNLQQRLLTLEAELTAEYQFYEHLMFLIMGICGLLIVSAIATCIFGGKRILTRVSALEATMSNIAETSDLSLRADAMHHDEIGSMAHSFNSMVEKLQETSKLVKQKINDIQTMLQNMPQGLLSFDENNKVKPEYSAFLEKILETDKIAGTNLMELIFAKSNLGSDPISQVAAIAGACVGEDVMNFEFNQHLLVNEIEKEMPNGTKKVLDLNWAPVVNENDVVEQILLCVKDVTELRKLSMEAASQKRELEIIGEILGVKPEKFNDFISSALTYIDEIEKVIRANPNGSEDAIKLMFRNMHTIKGNARTYGLANLTNPVHDVESVYNELRNTYPMIAWDEPRLLDDLAQIRALVEHYAKTNEVSLGRKSTGKATEGYLMVDIKHIHETIKMLEKVSDSNIHDLVEAQKAAQQTLKLLGTEPLDVTLASIVDSIPTLAKNLNKAEPNVSINNGKFRIKTQSAATIKDIFTHLFRNCVDHGLESAEERKANGKIAKGHIEVGITGESDNIRIAIKDDGRGLALGKIREKALNDGRIDANDQLDDTQIASLIFLSGLSTAEKLTDISGRGVGMDAVLNFAKKEGGDVKIHFLDDKEGSDFRAFETVVYLPNTYAVHAE